MGTIFSCTKCRAKGISYCECDERSESDQAAGSIAPCVNCYAFTDGECTRTKMLEAKCKRHNYYYFVEKPAAVQFGDALFAGLDADPELTQKLIDDGLVTRKGKQ